MKREGTAALTQPVTPEGVKRPAERRNMKRVAGLDNLPVEAVHCSANAFNADLGGVAESGVLIVQAPVRGKCIVVIEHVVGGPRIGASFVGVGDDRGDVVGV